MTRSPNREPVSMHEPQEIRDRYGPLVWSTVYRILRDYSEALDCCQDVLCEVLQQDSDFVFDTKMDESLFSTVPPEGYEIEERVPDESCGSYPQKDSPTS